MNQRFPFQETNVDNRHSDAIPKQQRGSAVPLFCDRTITFCVIIQAQETFQHSP
jgi:hypothetical protein